MFCGMNKQALNSLADTTDEDVPSLQERFTGEVLT
jgi:hypothetical protein